MCLRLFCVCRCLTCTQGSASTSKQICGCVCCFHVILIARSILIYPDILSFRVLKLQACPSQDMIDVQALGVLLSYICFQQLPFVGDCKLQVYYSLTPYHLCYLRRCMFVAAVNSTLCSLNRCPSAQPCSIPQVLNGDYTLPSTRPQPFLDLIRGLLCVSPAKRLGIDAVLQQLERLTSNLPAKILPSGPQSVNNAANSRENGNSTSDKIAASGEASPLTIHSDCLPTAYYANSYS